MKIETALISFAFLLSADFAMAQDAKTSDLKKFDRLKNIDFVESIVWDNFEVSQGIRYPMESMPAEAIAKQQPADYEKQTEHFVIKTNINTKK
jgi:hypothetical protein